MELIQAFETLHTIKYDVRSFDDPAVICEFTKDSLIKVFKDNKASFTKNLKVSNPLLKKCILSYNKERYEQLVVSKLIDKLVVLLQYIIDIKVTEPGFFTYDRSSKNININYSQFKAHITPECRLYMKALGNIDKKECGTQMSILQDQIANLQEQLVILQTELSQYASYMNALQFEIKEPVYTIEVKKELQYIIDGKADSDTKTKIVKILSNQEKGLGYVPVVFDDIQPGLTKQCASGTLIVSPHIPTINTLYQYRPAINEIIKTRDDYIAKAGLHLPVFINSNEDIRELSEQDLYKGVTNQGSPIDYSPLTFNRSNLQKMIKQRGKQHSGGTEHIIENLNKLIVNSRPDSTKRYMTSLNCFGQILSAILVFIYPTLAQGSHLEFINKALCVEANYKYMKVLLSKCKCSGTSTMLIKYLDHFYNIEGLNQLSKIYTKQDTKIKYFNINCFWGLMIGELVDSKLVDGKLVDGKLVINVELFQQFDWKLHLDHQVYRDIGFTTEYLVTAYETQVIIKDQSIGNDKQNKPIDRETYENFMRSFYNVLSVKQQQQINERIGIAPTEFYVQ